MIKIFQGTNTFCLFAVIVALAAFFAGCKPESSEKTAQTDDKVVLKISKGCISADLDKNGQTSETEAFTYYGSKLEENRQRLEDHNFALMRKFDANKDGRLEKSELRPYRKFRANLLSQSKADAGSASVPAASAKKTAKTKKTYTPRISDGCIESDTDENGQVSEEEAAVYYGSELKKNRKKIDGHNLVMMQTFDTNNDGGLDKGELGEYLQYRTALVGDIPGISKGCTMADTDENGQTSEEEASAYYRAKLEKNREKLDAHNLTMMQTYDTNKDGRLEKSELGEYLERRAILLHKIGAVDAK